MARSSTALSGMLAWNALASTFSSCQLNVLFHIALPLPTLLPLPLQVLNWNSHSVDDYLFEATQLVKDVDGMLKAIQDNVTKTRSILQQWQRDLMFDRKEGRVSLRVWCSSCLHSRAVLGYWHPELLASLLSLLCNCRSAAIARLHNT